MSFLTHGASALILVKHSEVILKISESFESGFKSIENIGRGFLDCLWRTVLIFLAWNPRDDSSFFMNEISVEGCRFFITTLYGLSSLVWNEWWAQLRTLMAFAIES